MSSRRNKDLRIRIAVWPDGGWCVLEQSYDSQDDECDFRTRMELDWEDGWETYWLVVDVDEIRARLGDA